MKALASLRFLLPLVALPCLQTAAQQPSGSPQVRLVEPLADTLRQFGLDMVRLLRERDVEAIVRLYGQRSQFVHVDNGVVIPWARLVDMMTKHLATAASNPVFVIGEPGVTIVDRDHAVLYVAHRVEEAEGRAAHTGVWSGVLHRTPGGWRIVHSHSSDRQAGH